MKKTFTIDARYNPGETIHRVFWDEDIDAWNAESFEFDYIQVKLYPEGHMTFEYCDQQFPECGIEEDEDMFETSLDASNEAKRRNHVRTVCGKQDCCGDCDMIRVEKVVKTIKKNGGLPSQKKGKTKGNKNKKKTQRA